jgi:hypothetical protein
MFLSSLIDRQTGTVKVYLSGNSSIGKVALAAYFQRAHCNSPMALAAYFCHYPVSRGISRAVLKVSEFKYNYNSISLK